MSAVEIILTRAMSDPAFADALLADPEKALADYDLSPEEIVKFKSMSRADFEILDAEERRSMSSLIATRKGHTQKPTENVSFNFNKISIKYD